MLVCMLSRQWGCASCGNSSPYWVLSKFPSAISWQCSQNPHYRLEKALKSQMNWRQGEGEMASLLNIKQKRRSTNNFFSIEIYQWWAMWGVWWTTLKSWVLIKDKKQEYWECSIKWSTSVGIYYGLHSPHHSQATNNTKCIHRDFWKLQSQYFSLCNTSDFWALRTVNCSTSNNKILGLLHANTKDAYSISAHLAWQIKPHFTSYNHLWSLWPHGLIVCTLNM